MPLSVSLACLENCAPWLVYNGMNELGNTHRRSPFDLLFSARVLITSRTDVDSCIPYYYSLER